MSSQAAEPGDFHGLPTGGLSSAHLRLEYLAEAGPRIVRLFLAGAPGNLLVEAPGFRVPTPHGDFSFRGGHRLWHSPEAMPRTYAPDDAGLLVEPLPDGVRLIMPAEPIAGIRKEIDVRLRPDRPEVRLEHRLRNDNQWPVELAPWAITQFPLGGVAVVPQPPGPEGLMPDRRFALWPYSRWSDPRFEPHDEALLLRAAPRLPPFKIGCLNTAGWLAYWRGGLLFCKRFAPPAGGPYPDFGSNAEVYCNDLFIELETLGPLRRLEPGETAAHWETWEVYRGLALPDLPEAIRTVLEQEEAQ